MKNKYNHFSFALALMLSCQSPALLAEEVTVKPSPENRFLIEQIQKAITYSPEIKSAAADKEAANWDVDQAKGQRWPQVQIGAAGPLASFGGSQNKNKQSIKDSSLSLSVDTTVFDWGKNRAQINSAQQLDLAADYNLRSVNEQIAYSTLTELVDLDRYQQQQKIAKDYVERMEELTHMLETIVLSDPGRSSELTQAQARLLAAQATLSRVDNDLRLSHTRLKRLTGEDTKLPRDFKWALPILPEDAFKSRLAKHPLLLKAKAETEASGHQAKAIKAGSWPQLNWNVSKNTRKDALGEEEEWYTGLGLQWNFSSGGSQYAAQKAALARAGASQHHYRQISMDMEHQVQNLLQTRNSAFSQAKSYEQLTHESEKVKDIFFGQWLNLGKRTLLDVLTAENEHFTYQVSAVNTYHDGIVANVKLLASVAMILDTLKLPTAD